MKNNARHYWKQWDEAPTGKLEILLDGRWDGTRYRFREGTRFTLEQKLPDFFCSLESRVERDEARRLEHEDRERQRQARWEAATDEARLRYLEQKRVEVLDTLLRLNKPGRVRLPEQVEPRPHELQPYLQGFSPYGAWVR